MITSNTNPIFVLVPNIGTCRLTAASTSRDASTTTNILQCFTAGPMGSRVDEVRFVNSAPAAGAGTANVFRLYEYNLITYRLIQEVAAATVTSSATVAGIFATMTFVGGLIVQPGLTLWASMHTAGGSNVDQTDVLVRGGDFI
jgi:hypothetical protein